MHSHVGIQRGPVTEQRTRVEIQSVTGDRALPFSEVAMFALSIALLALALITGMFGVGTFASGVVWLTCFVFALAAMVGFWRSHDEH